MSRLTLLSLICAVAAAWPGAAAAQLASPEKERGLAFAFSGEASFPLGDVADRFNPGAGFTIGAGYDFSKRLGLLAEYALSWNDVKSSLLPAADINGNQLLQRGSIEGLVSFISTDKAGAYVIGGPGLYYRRVEITRFEGTVATSFCDPWLLVCYPTAVPVEDIIGSANQTDFGLNVGLGGFLRLGSYVKLFLEARYHYIWGNEVDTPSGRRDTDAQYLPVSIGIRL